MSAYVPSSHGLAGIGRSDLRRRFPTAALDLLPKLRQPPMPTRPRLTTGLLDRPVRPSPSVPAPDADWFASPARWHTRFAP